MAGKGAWLDPRVVLVIAVAVALWVPLARTEWFSGHEQYSYVFRTVEWASELRAGALYPRWSPDLYGGYGSPFFVFYAPVVYSIAGLLTASFLTPFAALKTVVLLGSILSGVTMYALVYGETREKNAALLGALLYLGTPYRIGNLYDRGDIGEFFCIAFLPLVVALYRACAREGLPLRARWLAAGASVSHALLVMTHPVLGLWSTAIIGLIVAASALRLLVLRAWRRAALLVFAVVCAPGVAGLYVVPAMVYRSSAQTARMVVGFYRAQDHWLLMDELFADGTRLFTRNFLMVGQLVELAGVVTLLALAVARRRALGALGWLALTLLLVFSNSRTASGFWAPGRIPLTEFTQFPWRLLGPAALFAALTVAVAMAAVCARVSASARTSIAITAAAGFFFVVTWPYPSTTSIPYNGAPSEPEGIRQGIHAASDANEFLPRGVESPPARPRRGVVAEVAKGTVLLEHSDGSRHSLVVRAAERGTELHLALHGFPGWRVDTLDGPAKAELGTDARGLVLLRLPQPGEYRLLVRFGATLPSRLGLLLTLVTLGALALLVASGSFSLRRKAAAPAEAAA